MSNLSNLGQANSSFNSRLSVSVCRLHRGCAYHTCCARPFSLMYFSGDFEKLTRSYSCKLNVLNPEVRSRVCLLEIGNIQDQTHHFYVCEDHSTFRFCPLFLTAGSVSVLRVVEVFRSVSISTTGAFNLHVQRSRVHDII
jgi:hypothetical protein